MRYVEILSTALTSKEVSFIKIRLYPSTDLIGKRKEVEASFKKVISVLKSEFKTTRTKMEKHISRNYPDLKHVIKMTDSGLISTVEDETLASFTTILNKYADYYTELSNFLNDEIYHFSTEDIVFFEEKTGLSIDYEGQEKISSAKFPVSPVINWKEIGIEDERDKKIYLSSFLSSFMHEPLIVI